MYPTNISTIDRNMVICKPTIFTSDSSEKDKNMRTFELNCALALGIKRPDIIDPLIEKLYPEE